MQTNGCTVLVVVLFSYAFAALCEAEMPAMENGVSTLVGHPSISLNDEVHRELVDISDLEQILGDHLATTLEHKRQLELRKRQLELRKRQFEIKKRQFEIKKRQFEIRRR